MEPLLVATTTVSSKEQADALATALVTAHLVACAQVDGPIRSYYHWEGKLESSEEYRLTLKFPSSCLAAVEEALHRLHPYAVPQWLVWPASHAGLAYHKWAIESCSTQMP